MCFSNPDSHNWHQVNSVREEKKCLPRRLSSFSSPSPYPPTPFSLPLSFTQIFHFTHSFVFIQIFQLLPPLSLSAWMPTAILPSLSCLKDAEKAVTTEVGFKGSGWAQLYTTVWWSLLPICICKSLRILFVCLFEPGQVCWTRAKAEIKTSNPISYYTYCCYNSLLWSTFFPLEWRVEFAQSSRCCQFRGPRLHENFSKQKCYNHWCYIKSWLPVTSSQTYCNMLIYSDSYDEYFLS